MSTKITINNNGSIRVEGDFEICDPEGNKFDLAGRTAIGLCRCGASKNKPFCWSMKPIRLVEPYQLVAVTRRT